MAPSPDRVAIFLPLGVAVTLTFFTVVIHALALMPIGYFVRYELRLGRAGVLFWRDVGIVAGATLIALAAHLVAVAAWALVFTLCGEFSEFAPALYHSGMNYTTLGDSDKVMSPLEIAGILRSGKRHADVWRLNRYAFRGNSAIIPDQIQRLMDTGANETFP